MEKSGSFFSKSDELTGTSKCSVIPLPVCPRTPNDALSSMMSLTLYLYFSSILKGTAQIKDDEMMKISLNDEISLFILHLLFLEVVQCHHN